MVAICKFLSIICLITFLVWALSSIETFGFPIYRLRQVTMFPLNIKIAGCSSPYMFPIIVWHLLKFASLSLIFSKSLSPSASVWIRRAKRWLLTSGPFVSIPMIFSIIYTACKAYYTPSVSGYLILSVANLYLVSAFY